MDFFYFKDTHLYFALRQLEGLVLLVQLGVCRRELLDGVVEVILDVLHLLLQVADLEFISNEKGA